MTSFFTTLHAQSCGVLQDSDFVAQGSGTGPWWAEPGVAVSGDSVRFTQSWQSIGQRINGVGFPDRLRWQGRLLADETTSYLATIDFYDNSGNKLNSQSRSDQVDASAPGSSHWFSIRAAAPIGTNYITVSIRATGSNLASANLRMNSPCVYLYNNTTANCGLLADSDFSLIDGGGRTYWEVSSGTQFRGDTLIFKSGWKSISQHFAGFVAGEELVLSFQDSFGVGEQMSIQLTWYDINGFGLSSSTSTYPGGGNAWRPFNYDLVVPDGAVSARLMLGSPSSTSPANPIAVAQVCLRERVYGDVTKYVTMASSGLQTDTYIRGLKGVSGARTISIPQSDKVDRAEIFVYFTGQAPSLGQALTVNVDGTPVDLTRKLINRSTSDPAAVYYALVSGSVGLVTYANTQASSGSSALVVMAHRSDVTGRNEGGAVRSSYLHGGVTPYTRVSLAPSFSARDLQVSATIGNATVGMHLQLEMVTSGLAVKTVDFTLSASDITAGGTATLASVYTGVPAIRTYVNVRVRLLGGGADLLLIGPVVAQNLSTSAITVNGYGACNGSLGQEMFPDGDFGTVRELGGDSLIAPYDRVVWGDPPGATVAPGYTFVKGSTVPDGHYAIVSSTYGHYRIESGTSSRDSWVYSEDYGPEEEGYAMLVNASYDPGVFFYRRINNLCAGTDYTFTVAIKNVDNPIMRPNNPVNPGPPYEDIRILPDIDFVLAPVGASAYDLKTIPASYSSGQIMNDGDWHVEGFQFSLPPGVSSVVLAIRNNAPGGSGNDILLDNISFRACGPTTILDDVRPWCSGGGEVNLNTSLSGSYPSAVYQWEQSDDYAASWSAVPGATSPRLAPGIVRAGTLYRLRTAGSAANLSNNNCVVLSDPYAVPNGDCVEDCSNGIDDDLDGLIDCDDPDCQSQGNCPCATGNALIEIYQDISGSSLAQLNSAAKYPNSPDLRLHTDRLDMPDNIGARFGTRISGWIIPAVTGNYVFNVTGDDNADASLAITSQPGDEVRIAYHSGWTYPTQHGKYPTQSSGQIPLTAGRQYFYTLRSKEHYGGDNLQLYWRTPGSATWEIIRGSVLQSYGEGCRDEICTDGIDNDGDGLIDECDPECPSAIGSLNVSRS